MIQEALRYVVFSILSYFLSLRSSYFPVANNSYLHFIILEQLKVVTQSHTAD